MKIGYFIILTLLCLGIYLGTLTPSHDRDWYDYYERTSDASVSSTTVTLHNVRDWNHSTSSVIDRTWHDDITITTSDIESVWFGLNRFGAIPAIGHTFLTFETKTGEAYTLSIEARRQVGENYHSFRGLFNQYEVWYGWGTERDFVGVRLFLLNEPIEYYKLELTPDEAQALFVAVANETAAVSNEPRFYNTLTANCTNLLAKAINQTYPDRIPYHPSWNLPGLSITFLYRQQLLDTDIALETHLERADVSADDPRLLEAIYLSPTDFSIRLREQLTA